MTAVILSPHRLVDRHFAGATTPAQDRRLYRHLPRCQRCRERYNGHALLEALEPDGSDRARRRMAPAVFAAHGRGRWTWTLGLGLALATAWVLVPRTEAFRARGGGAVEGEVPNLSVFRVPAQGAPVRAGTVVRAGEGLAFSYRNSVRATHLLVFARDSTGRVFWYWPAWNSGADNPEALALGVDATTVELSEAVRHPLAPGPVTVHAFFARRAYHVREVEEAAIAGALQLLDGVLVTHTLEVVP